MKVSYKLLVPAFLAGLLLAGCGQKDDTAMPAEEAMDAAGEMATDAADAAGEMASDAADAAGEMAEDAAEAMSNEPGGYEPTDEERIPGVTRP